MQTIAPTRRCLLWFVRQGMWCDNKRTIFVFFFFPLVRIIHPSGLLGCWEENAGLAPHLYAYQWHSFAGGAEHAARSVVSRV